MEIDLSEYMGAYIDGSRENLDLMDKMLLNLEQNPSNIEAVGEIFRAAHTLKGMSATMGFEKVAHLTHEMENLLDKLRNNQVAVTPPIIDLIFETFDILRTLVEDSISQTESSLDLTDISSRLAAMASGSSPTSAPKQSSQNSVSFRQGDTANATTPVDLSDFGLSELEISGLEEAKDNGKKLIHLVVSLVADCLLKGPRVFMVMRAIDECQGEIIKSIPKAKDLENEKFDKSFKILLISPTSVSEIKSSIEGISEIESVEAIEVNQIASNSTTSDNPNGFSNMPDFSIQSQGNYSAPRMPAAPPPPSRPKPASYPSFQAESAPAVQRSTPTQSVTPVSIPTAPTQPAVAQPTVSKPASTSDTAENENEEEKEVIGFTQLITFTMANETYALEIKQVEAIINLTNITRVPKAPTHIDGVINLRGEIIPVINTRRRLKLADVEKSPQNQIIILSFAEEKVKAGFLVDNVKEVIRMPETSIEPPSRVSESVDIEYLKGVGKIDSKIIILLNAHRIVFDNAVKEE